MKRISRVLVTTLMISLLATSLYVPSLVGAAPKEKVSFKVFWPSAFPALNEVSEAQVAAWEKATNSEIKILVQPSSNYAEKLQLMVVSGDFPDAVVFNNLTEKVMFQGAENKVFIPLNKYLTTQNAPNIMKYTYPSTFETAKILKDDNIYLMPRTSPKRYDGYIIRKDWLANVGIKIKEGAPVSLDTFKEILKRFTLNDPDKNGKNDTVGIAEVATAGGNVFPIAKTAFGYLGWQAYTEGKYKYMDPQYSRTNKRFGEMLNFSKDVYKNGYIDKSWPLTKDTSTVLEKGYAGIRFGFAGQVSLQENQTKKINPKATYTYISGVSDTKTGKMIGSAPSSGMYGGWALTSAAKDPARVVNAFDWMVSKDGWDYAKFGAPGLTYNKTSTGFKVTPKYSDRLNSFMYYGLRRNNDPQFFVDMSLTPKQRVQIDAWIGTAMKAFVDSKDNGYRPEIADNPAFIEAENQRIQMITKVIIGSNTYEDYLDTLENWYKKGGEAYVKQMNDYIVSKEKK